MDNKSQLPNDANTPNIDIGQSDKDIPTRIEVKNMILEGKLDIAQRTITIILALFVILGIALPLVLSFKQDVRVDRAIDGMESRFKELAGEYLRKPEIICTVSGENLLNNSLAVGHTGDKTSQTFMIKNIGDASAGMTNIYLYVKHKEDNPFLSYAWGLNNSVQCEIDPNDNPRYDTKFLVCRIGEFHAGREFDFRFEHSLKIDSSLEVQAMLKIFYNGPKPIEVPFKMKFIPKEIKSN
jgi:hypothetical protein